MLKPLAKQVGTAQQHGETTADRAEAVVLSAQHGRERSGLPKRARLRVWVGAGRGIDGRTCVGSVAAPTRTLAERLEAAGLPLGSLATCG